MNLSNIEDVRNVLKAKIANTRSMYEFTKKDQGEHSRSASFVFAELMTLEDVLLLIESPLFLELKADLYDVSINK